MAEIILSILIPSEYSVEEASQWVKSHGYILRKVHTTKKYHRFRQHTTKYAENRGYTDIKTIPIGGDGIQFIVAYNRARLEGGGIIETAKGLYDTTKAIVYGRSKYAPAQQQIIDKYGSQEIQSIKVGRSPLPSLINKALDILTFGNFKKLLKQYSYDKLYHLFCIITLSSGVKILVEKNQGINIKVVSSYNPKNAEYVQAHNIPSGLTFQELLDNGQKVLGKNYYPYDSTRSNCQQYIKGLLQGSSILTKELQDFIYQDVASLFKDYQIALKVVKGITDIGSVADIIRIGGKRIKDIP